VLYSVDLASKCGRCWPSVSSVGCEGTVPPNTTTHIVCLCEGVRRMELQSELVYNVMKGTEYFVSL
jgi:hypothetical protein